MPGVAIGGIAVSVLDGARWGRESLLFTVVLFSLVLTAESGQSGRAEAAWPPPFLEDLTVEILWNDHYQLLEKKLPPAGRALLNREIERIFDAVGVAIRFREEEPSGEDGALSIRVVLVPTTGEGWNLPLEAMGAVLGRERVRRTLYVFFPSVLFEIGHRRAIETRVQNPWEMQQVALGLARVVAHEVVHAIDPGIPHAEAKGIMSARLGRRMLEEEQLSLTERTGKRLRASLAALVEAGAAGRAPTVPLETKNQR